MKIVFYCQHVLGIGHFFRSLEICRALDRHRVLLVTGGPRLDVVLPPHVSEVRLPALEMDCEFKELHAAAGADLDTIRRERQQRLRALFETERPDLFLIELYPFGRRAFRLEIDPVLEAMTDGRLPRCGVVCSVRDILVEKAEPEKREARTVGVLNRFFDAVLVHADPRLVRLEETFSRLGEIRIPLAYTGFITPMPAADARQRIRSQLGLTPADRLIVVSAGGGRVGMPLLKAAVAAIRYLDRPGNTLLQVFTGPFLPDGDFERLEHAAGPGTTIARFTPEFLSYLAAADLSVSMAGYNTTMNLLAARVPALVWPFSQNREQRLRSERLEALGVLQLLPGTDLEPTRLAARMSRMLERPERPKNGVDLNGASATARWINDFGLPPGRAIGV
ncbi:MAG: glycosyltransferase family protein [Hyphomicrobiales bacterium]